MGEAGHDQAEKGAGPDGFAPFFPAAFLLGCGGFPHRSAMALWTATRKGDEFAELKAQFETPFRRFAGPPADMHFEAGRLGPVAGEWLRGPRLSPSRLLLYFHGGGFITGSPESHRGLIAALAEAGEAEVFSPRYRLAPDCVYPAPVRDGVDAYRGLIAAGVSPSRMVLAGDGSGGGLAFAVALAVRNAGLEMPAGLIALSPWADLTLSGWSMLRNQRSDGILRWETLFRAARHYLRKANPADIYASPVFANLKEFPPIMVHAGALEILRDDASRLGDRAAEAAVPVSVEIYDGMGHLFQTENRNEAQVSLARLGQFIKSKIKAPA
jgi:acetyl esterase/lipase